MTLDQYRNAIDAAIDPFVDIAIKAGLTPHGVSVIGFGWAIAAGGAFVFDTPLWYLAGAAFVFINGWMDIIDGALARRLGSSTDSGDMLDHVLDRYADMIIIIGLAAGKSAFAFGLLAVTGVVMTSYLGTQIQAVGLGRAYGGLLGRADRLALISITAVVSAVLSSFAGLPSELLGFSLIELLLLTFALVGHLTAIQRFRHAWSDLQ